MLDDVKADCSFGTAFVFSGGGCDGNGYCSPLITDADDVDVVDDDGDNDATLLTIGGFVHTFGKLLTVGINAV